MSVILDARPALLILLIFVLLALMSKTPLSKAICVFVLATLITLIYKVIV
jgi:hypothetical protein